MYCTVLRQYDLPKTPKFLIMVAKAKYNNENQVVLFVMGLGERIVSTCTKKMGVRLLKKIL